MKFRYIAEQNNDEENNLIYVRDKHKFTINNSFSGYVEADNEEEAKKIAIRVINKIAPNCNLVNIFEVTK